jgi:tRNA(Ile)-lysidine synthase TilS/MesJ
MFLKVNRFVSFACFVSLRPLLHGLFLKTIPSHKTRTFLRRHNIQWSDKESCWKRDRCPVAMFNAPKAIDKLEILNAREQAV